MILEAAHEPVSGDALAAEEAGAVLARRFSFALVFAGSADRLLVAFGRVDANHRCHHVVNGQSFHSLARLKMGFLVGKNQERMNEKDVKKKEGKIDRRKEK